MEDSVSTLHVLCGGMNLFNSISVSPQSLTTWLVHAANCTAGLPALNMPHVCTASPAFKQVFCPEHCQLLQNETPPIPTDLRSLFDYCKHKAYEGITDLTVTLKQHVFSTLVRL